MPVRLITRTQRIRNPLSYSKRDPGTQPSFSYGKFNFDYVINYDGLTISFNEKNGMYHYHRAIADWMYEADVAVKNGRYLIQPIEPLNLPENVTDFLEIQFNEIKIEPDGTTIIFLTIPLEIGIFLETQNGKRDLLDIVTFTHPKYSLYGAATRGVITRIAQSEVYADPPLLKNHIEGMLRVEIKNKSDAWVSVGRIVIYQKGLELYYDEVAVAACAVMTITSPGVAVVSGIDQPLTRGMTKCTQVFEQRKTSAFYNIHGMLIDKEFTMDMGLS